MRIGQSEVRSLRSEGMSCLVIAGAILLAFALGVLAGGKITLAKLRQLQTAPGVMEEVGR